MNTEKFMKLWVRVSSLFMAYFLFNTIRRTYNYLTYEAPSELLLSSTGPDLSSFFLRNLILDWPYLVLIGVPIIYFSWFKQSKLYPRMVLWSNLGIILVSTFYIFEMIVDLSLGGNIWNLFTRFSYLPPYLPLPLLIIFIAPLFYYTWKNSERKIKPDTGI